MNSRTAVFALLLAGFIGLAPVARAAPACEPGKAAQKYPELASKTIRIGADPETPPYVMRDPKDFNKVTGSDVDLAEAVMKCDGLKYTFFLGGWSGLMPATIAGQIDVFWDTVYYTPERAEKLSFVVYMEAATGGMTQADNPKHITGLDATACGSTIAVGLGTVEQVEVQTQDKECKMSGNPGITIMTYPDMAAGIRLIQSRRADVMMTNLALVDYLVATHPKEYARAFKILTGFRIAAAVKKGNTELLNAIADGLRALQSEGKEKAILTKYNIGPDLRLPVTVLTK